MVRADQEINITIILYFLHTHNSPLSPRFRDSKDLIHRLFVCISIVADQLQTNYASHLRKILKCVFLINQTEEEEPEESAKEEKNPALECQ